MDLVLFPGFADSNAKARERFIRDTAGYAVRKVGNDFVVDSDDPALVRGLEGVVHITSQPWALSPERYASVARAYVRHFRSTQFDGVKHPQITSVSIDSQYGLKSRLREAQLRFFLYKGHKQELALIEHVFPLLHGELKLDQCFGVKVDAVRLQGMQSILKIPLLISEFGPAKAEYMVRRAGALDSILPMPTEVFAYLEALITFGRFAIALPIHEVGTALYFRSEGLCEFSELGMENNFEQLGIGLGPLIAESSKRQQFLLRGLGDRGYDGMLGKAVDALNRMLAYLHDPRSFLRNGRVDTKRLLQAQATVRLLMADCQSMNFTSSPYVRIKLALSALDKISNLWKGVGFHEVDESEVFVFLLSSKNADYVADVLTQEFREVSKTASVAMGRSVRGRYREIQNEMRSDLGSTASDDDIGEALRTLRNASHGAFLKKGQFERRFLTLPTALPNEIEVFAFFVIWALFLRPQEFLSRTPRVG